MTGSESRARFAGAFAAVALLFGATAVAAAGLSDPTRPPGRHAAVSAPRPLDPANWRLTVVRIAPGDRSAVINGQVVRVGDGIGSARVVAIQPARVVLDRDGARLTLAPGGGAARSERVVVKHLEESP